MTNIPYITGRTPNGELLVGGLFTLKDTHGMPLDMSCDLCRERGWHVDWFEYLLDAGRQEGWKWDAATAEMELLVGDQLGRELVDRYKQACALAWLPSDDFTSVNQRLWAQKQPATGNQPIN